MENKNLIYFLAGFGTVSILVMAYNKFVAKPVTTKPSGLITIGTI